MILQHTEIDISYMKERMRKNKNLEAGNVCLTMVFRFHMTIYLRSYLVVKYLYKEGYYSYNVHVFNMSIDSNFVLCVAKH